MYSVTTYRMSSVPFSRFSAPDPGESRNPVGPKALCLPAFAERLHGRPGDQSRKDGDDATKKPLRVSPARIFLVALEILPAPVSGERGKRGKGRAAEE
jgi:hypothetical protein